MAFNTNPVSSAEDIRSKYADKFVQDKNSSMITIENFFKLLMNEMTNQDPLEPTSNSEFVSQLASFSALQTNTDALYYNKVNYASGLAGKTVTVATQASTKDDLKIVTGMVTGVDISDDNEIEITVNGQRFGIGSIMNVSDSGSTSATGSNGAFAVSLIGKNVTIAATNSKGETIIDGGTVESIEVENGQYRIVMGGLSYPLSSVIKVGGKVSTDSTDNKGDTSSSGGSNNTDNNNTSSAGNATETTAAYAASGTEETRLADDSKTNKAAENETALTDENSELKMLFS